MLQESNKNTTIYPSNFEGKSGFVSVRTMLNKLCHIEYSRNLAASMTFITDFDRLNELLEQTSQMKYVLQFLPGFPQQDYYDLSSELMRIKLRGTFFEPETLPQLKLSLETITNIIHFIQNLDEKEFNELKKLLPGIIPERAIIERVNKMIDEKGEIRDNASPALASIRKDIKSRVSSIDRKINQILGQARRDSLVGDDTELTIRNGRLVIPLPSGNKRKLKGYVHDTSATGQTVFLEPAEVFEINNDIQNLRVEEKEEIIKILIDFTDFVRSYSGELLLLYRFLGIIDFIRAKAVLALELNSIKPQLVEYPFIQWRNAVHPLLNSSLSKQGKTIVPQDISLNNQERIMLISGPNAGGKSVTLKTVALLQYMLQCGMLIPVGTDSVSGIFSKIFLEIGDEQSLENDLSTYSSHLIHIKYFLENVDERTIFLIDEFGSGTEPQLGGAMAEASLQKLNKAGSYGVVTTHYTNLKLLADNEPGLFNAAMLYDTKAMRPLFKLSTGKPGSSFAFEIANKIGFPEDVLQNAASKIGSSQLDFEKQLAQLEVDKKEISRKTAELKIADETLAELHGRYQKLLADLESRKTSVMKDARVRAQQIVDQSNKMIEKAIRDIKEQKAEKEATKLIRENLSKAIEEVFATDDFINEQTSEPDRVVVTSNSVANPLYLLKKGAYVKMEGQETIGIVEELKGNRAQVWFGSFKIRTTIDKLVLATEQESKFYESSKSLTGRGNSIVREMNSKMADFKMTIDIRGKKPEEARETLAKYIDQAVLLRVHEVRVLHGKGTGVLRSMAHEMLTENPDVIRVEDESLDRGGHGISVVYLH
ncbi:MAG TPA: Smr/MutS family protein [Lentimicrobium sp.]|nr:Smr/MutS family protein [Lentimicrobium sp.]